MASVSDLIPLFVKDYRSGRKSIYVPNFLKVGVGRRKEASPSPSSSIKNSLDSLNRTRKTIYDVGVSNDWEWFCTFTFALDRTDYLGKFDLIRSTFKSLKRIYPDFSYLFVPELHKKTEEDGKRAVHFHGVLSGLPSSFFVNKKWTRKYGLVYNFAPMQKFGFTTCNRVRDKVKAGIYMTKYITKDLTRQVPHKAMYIVSRGLKRPEHKKYYIRADYLPYFLHKLSHMRALSFYSFYGSSFSFDDDGDIDDFVLAVFSMANVREGT